jgi:hypothetical protein
MFSSPWFHRPLLYGVLHLPKDWSALTREIIGSKNAKCRPFYSVPAPLESSGRIIRRIWSQREVATTWSVYVLRCCWPYLARASSLSWSGRAATYGAKLPRSGQLHSYGVLTRWLAAEGLASAYFLPRRWWGKGECSSPPPPPTPNLRNFPLWNRHCSERTNCWPDDEIYRAPFSGLHWYANCFHGCLAALPYESNFITAL